MDIGTPERYARAQALAARPGAIFVDRDGTINAPAAPGEYVTTREDFWFLPGALDALAFLAQNSERRIVVLTNQPAVGKGEATRAQVDALHNWMVGLIEEAGGRVDGVYVCPHAPDEGCDCRKPAPGMLLRAAEEKGLDLSKSTLIGDTKFDLQAGWAAGVRECCLVLTGRGPLWRDRDGDGEYAIYAGLMDAARAVIERGEET